MLYLYLYQFREWENLWASFGVIKIDRVKSDRNDSCNKAGFKVNLSLSNFEVIGKASCVLMEKKKINEVIKYILRNKQKLNTK